MLNNGSHLRGLTRLVPKLAARSARLATPHSRHATSTRCPPCETTVTLVVAVLQMRFETPMSLNGWGTREAPIPGLLMLVAVLLALPEKYQPLHRFNPDSVPGEQLEDALVGEGGWELLAVKPPVNLSATNPMARDMNRTTQASLMGLPRLSGLQLLEPPGADPHAGWCGRGPLSVEPPLCRSTAQRSSPDS